MIKANELRIGNRIICAGVTMIVTGWDIYQLNKYIRENDTLADKYEPIPLTPEILESAGFICINKVSLSYKKYTNDADSECFILSLSEVGNGKGFKVKYAYNDDVSIKRRVFHLHELQNLYYSITKEELIINLHATA